MRISDWSSDVCSSDLVVDQGCKRTPIQGLADVGKDAASERLIFNRPAQITGNIVFAGQVCRMGYEVRCDDAIAGVGEYTDQGIANASRSTGYKYNLHGAPRRDRKSVGEGKGGYDRVTLGGRRNLKKK